MSHSLCSTCRSINFRKYSYTKRLFALRLGSWEKVSKRKNCPFCSLVKAAILSDSYRPSDRSVIKLSNKRSWKCCKSYNEYHGTREMDYSNEFDLHSHASETRTESRYQYYLSWNYGFCEIYLRPVRPGPFFGRIVDRELVNLELCRTWLDLCEKYHTGSSKRCISDQTSRLFLQGRLRVIDVKSLIIKRGLGEEDEYVALTYVWGEKTLKKEKPRGWRMPRTLKRAVRVDDYGQEVVELPHNIPRTIRDAIDVTRSLGYRYLWVDSLCIVQDDETDQEIQIGMMDEIYSNATLTIAAGSGLRKFS
ncbi:MAG: hypothetical protein CL912_30205 [Deltaproteobacteria bacterium]|nr:hypothetical protein [Deltaproteobacteria bacterium]